MRLIFGEHGTLILTFTYKLVRNVKIVVPLLNKL